jgi:hypothetical protein
MLLTHAAHACCLSARSQKPFRAMSFAALKNDRDGYSLLVDVHEWLTSIGMLEHYNITARH